MNINVSMKSKSISINVFTSINFDDIDFDKDVIFVWRNEDIAGSIVLPSFENIYIDFWVNDDECKSFANYKDFRKFYNEYKNLVK